MKILDKNKQFYDFVIQDLNPNIFWERKEICLSELRHKSLNKSQLKVISYFDSHWAGSYISKGMKNLAILAIGDIKYYFSFTFFLDKQSNYYILDFKILTEQDKELKIGCFSKKTFGDIINNNDFNTKIKEYQIAFDSPVVLFMPYTRTPHYNTINVKDFKLDIINSPNLNLFVDFLIQDSMLIYQEIETWLGRISFSSITTVGDDKIIAKSKGFDEKSFRKEPNGRK